MAGLVRLTLVGTGHVFRISEIVEEIIIRREPHVVCVELDPVRLAGLQDRARLAAYEEAGDPRAEVMRRQHEEATKRLPWLYRFLAKLQERLADEQGVEAGNEMLAAVNAANRLEAPVATIDVDAQALIRRAWSQMRWKERLRFVWAIMRGRKGAEVEAELEEYQEDPVAYLARVGDEFPTLKRVLIDERDAHMAKQIIRLKEMGVDGVRRLAEHQKYAMQADTEASQKEQGAGAAAGGPSGNEEATAAEKALQGDEDVEELAVVAVVGDGHVPGMLGILEEHLDGNVIETIRVGDLRAGRIPEAENAKEGTGEQSGDAGSVSMRFDVESVDPPDRGPY